MSHGPWPSLPERVGRLEATIESLVRENEQLRRRVADATEAEEILRRAHRGEPALPALAVPKPSRDRSHLRVVKGIGIVAALAALWHLLWGSAGRRVATVAAGLAIGGATVVTPAIHAGANPPQPHTPPRAQRPAATAPGGPPPPRHHTRATAGTRRPQSHSSPSPVPSPSPAASTGSPVPLPSPTLPVPLPTPTPPSLTGCVKHPHPGCPTPPADLPQLPSLLDGNVVSAADWLRAKTHRLKLLGVAA